MKKKIIFCFDLDNVICKTSDSDYSKSIPLKKNINFINKLKKNGNTIKIFTARCMGRNNESKIKAQKQGYNFTKKQLKKWKVKYDQLIFGKPTFDIYIDDKNLGFRKNWTKQLKLKFKIK